MKITIDKNIPIPPKKSARQEQSPYPFEEMEVGDSIFVFGNETIRKSVTTMANSMLTKRGQSGKKFSTRATTPDGFRVWRIA